MAIIWQRMVASAAPWMPIFSTKMKIGSRMALEMTVNRVRFIATLGCPEERIRPLKPKYRCVNALPSRMMSM
jgi:hypothetical protein